MRKKAVFGLGNYGELYRNTRHNIGSEILKNVANYLEKGESFFKEKEEWEILPKKIKNKEVLFIRLKGFINNSGLLIKKFMKSLDLKISDIILIQDDVSIEFGKIRFKKNSSSGGHNGIKSVIEELKTDSFCRIKVGIGGKNLEDLKKWVLKKFTEEEMNKVNQVSQETAKLLLNWIEEKV